MNNFNLINEKNDLKKGIGDNVHFYSVTTDSSGNHIVVGNESDRTGSTVALIVKVNKDGNMVWHKRIGSYSNGYFYSVAADSSGNYIAVGREQSSVSGNYEALIAKFDTNGSLLWQKRLDSDGISNGYFYSVAADSSGNYIAVGREQSSVSGNSEALIAKFDIDGNLLWQKRLGGAIHDSFKSVITDSSGNFIAVGNEYSSVSGNYEALIVKFDTDGNLLWQKRLGGANGDYFHSVTTDSSGNYIAVGYEVNSDGHYEALIAKFDIGGNVIWRKQLTARNKYYLYSIVTDLVGNYITVGYGLSDNNGTYNALIVKFDTNGNLLWQKRLGDGGEIFNSVTTDSSGNYTAVGSVRGNGNTSNALIVKFDTDGGIVTESI